MITHPEKVLFPADGGFAATTKGDLAAYYETIAPIMVPHIRARPVTMERYPSGIDKKGFIQKDVVKGIICHGMWLVAPAPELLFSILDNDYPKWVFRQSERWPDSLHESRT